MEIMWMECKLYFELAMMEYEAEMDFEMELEMEMMGAGMDFEMEAEMGRGILALKLD
jgi:hypothetical protein